MFSTDAILTFRRVMALAAIVAAVSFASEAQAGRYSKGRGVIGGGPGSSSGSSGGVPEIDAGSAAGAVSLLVGGVFLLRDQLNRRGKRAE